jgi:tRNA(His) 5'-end guanylyltransferase
MDDLGDRMKGYENISRIYLTKRIPIILRIDGKSFHSFTKGFKRPYDEILNETMWETSKYLCKNVEGCKLAYVQSDEISLLLTDYENITTESWFGKNMQKMVSVSASMATLAFNKEFQRISSGEEPYSNKYNMAMFDSRVFILPKEEVCNYFIWRQQDATRNYIQSLGQSKFSHKELNGKGCNEIQEMLFSKFEINFNDFPICQRRGIAMIKEQLEKDGVVRSRWITDLNIPVFTENRGYIERFL